MARPRKAMVEGAARDDVTGEFQSDGAEHAERFMAAVAEFQSRFPADWDAIRLCPTLHGVEIIAERLKG